MLVFDLSIVFHQQLVIEWGSKKLKDGNRRRTLYPGDDCGSLVFNSNQSDHLVESCLGGLVTFCIKLISTIRHFLAALGFSFENNDVAELAIETSSKDSNLRVVYWNDCWIHARAQNFFRHLDKCPASC